MVQIGDPEQPPPPPTWSDTDQVPVLDSDGNINLDAEGRQITVSEEQLNLWPEAPEIKDDPEGVERVVETEIVDGQEVTVEKARLLLSSGVVQP